MKRGVQFRGRAVSVYCTDKWRSEHFYHEVLGAEPIPGDGYGCPWFRLGPLTVTLCPAASQPSPARFSDHPMSVLWLETDDLVAAKRHLERHNVPITEYHEGLFLMAADPDGLPIEIWPKADQE